VKTAKDQKASSRAPAGEERDHVHVSSARWRAEQEDKGKKTAYRPRYPQQGGDQLSLCLPKAAQWLLATPLKKRGRCRAPEEDVSFLHPLRWTSATTLRRLRPWKIVVYSCPPSLAVYGNPFPKKIRGRRTLAL
jgi:hypothetical protein